MINLFSYTFEFKKKKLLLLFLFTKKIVTAFQNFIYFWPCHMPCGVLLLFLFAALPKSRIVIVEAAQTQ